MAWCWAPCWQWSNKTSRRPEVVYWRGLLSYVVPERPSWCCRQQLSNLFLFAVFLKREVPFCIWETKIRLVNMNVAKDFSGIWQCLGYYWIPYCRQHLTAVQPRIFNTMDFIASINSIRAQRMSLSQFPLDLCLTRDIYHNLAKSTASHISSWFSKSNQTRVPEMKQLKSASFNTSYTTFIILHLTFFSHL